MADTLIDIPIESPQPILALGPELKSTVCLLQGRRACISEDHGHLADPNAYRAFLNTVERLRDMAESPPRVLAHDLHPDYAATRYARQLRNVTLIPVQHHHAHVAAASAEHGLAGRVVGVACDGTGYGTDGNIWGGEILLAETDGRFTRAGHLAEFPLPGGDAAAIDTFRPAAGLVHAVFGPHWPEAALDRFARIDAQGLAVLRKQLASPTARIVRTTSTGRLFDAVAFLLGLCDRNTTEAAAPIALQTAAQSTEDTLELDSDILLEDDNLILDTRPLVRSLLNSIAAGNDPAALARGFHRALAALLAEGAIRTCRRADTQDVVLSGGCFLNPLLTAALSDRLAAAGLNVYTHGSLSPGDACVSLGQAMIAAQTLSKGTH
jgi:hydrogenase maturation protein HypF